MIRVVKEFIAEVIEEFVDFIEDFRELLQRQPAVREIAKKPAVIRGELTFIRPAYLFAERVENAIKILFGVSVLLSAITSTFVGFASLSSLVEALVDNIFGRLTLFVIGFSYVIIAIWKTLHLNKAPK